MHKITVLIIVAAITLGSFYLVASHSEAGSVRATFDQLWRQADSLKSAGQPAAATKTVEAVLNKAQLENNAPQVVKALLYRESLRSSFQEDYFLKSIRELESWNKKLESPARQIIASALAEMYMGYFRANQYEILQRTHVNVNEADVASWDGPRILTQVNDLYNSSLSDFDLLKSIPSLEYAIVLERDSLSHDPLPTLYDVINHRAINHFASDDGNMLQAGNRKTFTNPRFLAPAVEFAHDQQVQLLLLKTDVMNLYREAIAFHLHDKDPSALIDIDLRRLAYVYERMDLAERDSLYIHALQALENRYRNFAGATRISYRIALLYQSMSSDVIAKDQPNADRLLSMALTSARQAVALFPQSAGSLSCQSLIAEIERPGLTFSVQEAVLPDAPFELNLGVKNIDTLWFRLIKLSTDDLIKMQISRSDSLMKRLTAASPLIEWSEKLNSKYQYVECQQKMMHRPLEKGAYLLMAAQSNSFSNMKSIMGVTAIQVTRLAYVVPPADERSAGFMVVDRLTGFPLKGVKTTLRSQRYEPRSRNYSTVKQELSESNAQGEIELGKSVGSSGFYLQFSSSNDGYIPFSAQWFGRNFRTEQQPHQQIWLFTDRGIYRPGQQVWYKGIAMSGIPGKYLADEGQRVKVMLYDANNQQVDVVEAVTNAYGSFSGSFILPSNGLPGNYRIATHAGGQSFRVESYKRPEFAVLLHQPGEAFTPGDAIVVSGKAEAYSGYAVMSARVSYTVVRSLNDRWWRGWYSQQRETVAQGEVVTNEKGEFEFTFVSSTVSVNLPEREKNFTYTVDVTVTDVAGESHQKSISVYVSPNNLFVRADVAELINIDDLTQQLIRTETSGGQPTAASLVVNLYRLVQPDSVYWPKNPSSNQYRYLPPQKNNMAAWPKGALMATYVLKYPADSLVDLRKAIAEPGVYALAIEATDLKGNRAEEVVPFTVYDVASAQLPFNNPDWVVQIDRKVKKGGEMRFIYGSTEKDARYLVQVRTERGLVSQRWLDAGKRQRIFRQPVSSEMEGNVQVTFVMVRQNRFFSHHYLVAIEDFDNDLVASLTTSRDQTTPGALEKWNIRITNRNGKPLDAQVLATMYDASLDAFVSHFWSMNTKKYPWTGGNWNTAAFSVRDASIEYVDTTRYYAAIDRRYSDLNWFGYQFYHRFSRFSGGDKMRNSAMEPMMESAVFASAKQAGEVQEPMNEDVVSGIVAVPGDAGAGEAQPDQVAVSVRSNLNETAFFYPALHTDSAGNAEISFVMPDALTKWNFMALAHTRNGITGTTSHVVVSSRDVMAIPAFPRFVRTGDSLSLPVRVINTTNKPLKAVVSLKLLDAVTGDPLSWWAHSQVVEVQLGANETVVVQWPCKFPDAAGLIRFETSAVAGQQTDGVAGTLPVLSSQIRLTNTKAFTLNGKETFEAVLGNYLDAGAVADSSMVKITAEYASNPAWYVVQALPALNNSGRGSLHDVLYQYYSASMGALVMSTYPEIKSVVEEWQRAPKSALYTKGVEDDLRLMGFDDTPWIPDFKSEESNRQHLAGFFDQNNLTQLQKDAIDVLASYQMSNGGFYWYKGMPDSRYLTGLVVETFGRLATMKAIDLQRNAAINQMITRAVGYLDNRMLDDYKEVLRNSVKNKPTPNASQLHYLFVRSYFFASHPVEEQYREAFRFYQEGVSVNGIAFSPMLQAMSALALFRAGDAVRSERFMASLADKMLTDADGNLYWRREYGDRWYDAPLETQSVVIEAWNEIKPGSALIENMKGWLLSRKRTEAWESQPATAGACYAFLLQGSKSIGKGNPASILFQGAPVNAVENDHHSGYFRAGFSLTASRAFQAHIQFTGEGTGPGWGGVFVQYDARQEHVKAADGGFKVDREVFKMVGHQGEPLTKGMEIKKGDLLKIRLVVKSERDMEFVALRDLRAAGLEPVDVLSGYEWNGGASYYKVTSDASVDFFFDQFRKGSYVFEYDVHVTRNGTFSDGPATVQCLYAPVFSGRSGGNLLKL